MSLRQRRLLFLFFILLFIAIVPAVLLYATGQHLNWRRFEFEKTSSIIIDSNPSDATVLLNGEPAASSFIIPLGQAVRTKAKLSSLAPAEYTVGLSKDGYWPWQESIALKPGEAANIGIIKLFRNETPQLLATDAVLADRAVFSNSRRYLLLLAHDAAGSVDLENPEKRFSFAIPADPASAVIRWSPDERRVIIGSRIIDLADGTMTNLNRASGLAVTEARWDEEDADGVFLIANASLYRFSLSSSRTESIGQLPAFIQNRSFVDYAARGRRFYFITEEGRSRQTLLITDSEGRSETTISLPAGIYHFDANRINNQPLLYDETKKALYLIEEPLPLLRRYRISNAVEEYAIGKWINSDLAYATPFELRYWSKSNGQSSLLTRLGQAVRTIEPLGDSGYIAYSTDTSVTLFGIKPDPFMNPLEIISGSSVKTIASRENGSSLYVYGTLNDQSGLFKIGL